MASARPFYRVSRSRSEKETSMTTWWQSYPGFLATLCRFEPGARLATPSPGPPRLTKTPVAGHPLPQGGEGWKLHMARKISAQMWKLQGGVKAHPSLYEVRNPGYNYFRENASISTSKDFTCAAEGASA